MKKEEGIKNLYKNYLFYTEMIPYLETKIKEMEYRLTGVSAIRFDKQHGSSNRNYIEQKKLEMIDELEIYREFQEMCIRSIRVMSMMFNRLTPEERKVLSDLYIFQSKQFDEVSKEKDMSASGLHKQFSKTLGEMI